MNDQLLSGRLQRDGRRGATIVEFALSFVLFIVVLMGLMELGRGMWTYGMLAHAARAAGRYCMVRGTQNPAVTTELRDLVENNCRGLEASSIVLETKWKDPTDGTVRADVSAVERGDVIELKVKYPFQFVTGGLIVPNGTISMSAKTQMIVAN